MLVNTLKQVGVEDSVLGSGGVGLFSLPQDHPVHKILAEFDKKGKMWCREVMTCVQQPVTTACYACYIHTT